MTGIDSEELRPRAFRIAYDGRAYHGFQRQPTVPTVSDAILEALAGLGVVDADDADNADNADNAGDADDADNAGDVPPGYAAAGRTDAGVSALAQTVALEAPEWLSPSALNAELPVDVRAWASADVDADFHPTHDAASRTYTYYLHSPAEKSDDGAVERAATTLSGEHDVHNLTADDSGTVRTLSVDVRREGEFLVLTVTAGGFPRSLVRRLAGLLDAVGSGAASQDRVERVLGAEPLDGPEGVPAAPPEPLVLTAVAYPTVDFRVDPEAVRSARAVFAARRIEHRTNARVAAHLLDGIE